MKKVVVIDFDGCLCSVNSFRFWILFTYLFSLLSFRWVVFVKLNIFALLRVMRVLNRVQMKKKVLGVTEIFPDYFIRWFGAFLNRYTNKSVLSLLWKYSEMKASVVLNTAAPECYVKESVRRFGFTHIFATGSVYADEWVENIGIEKLAVLENLYGKGFTFECVVTDHHDDLPLLMRAKKRILVNPSRNTLKVIGDQFEYDVL